jgi:hypothetical protein
MVARAPLALFVESARILERSGSIGCCSAQPAGAFSVADNRIRALTLVAVDLPSADPAADLGHTEPMRVATRWSTFIAKV